ncbi:MAG: RIP metalloprotease RseP [Candidatus Doudnabacteria bacterium CG10_big_fil_rev_8_21_14_0_10_42_18]|uniref:Zinc metalloprotease n=1 Tax=Candidatus Doudnabacteria bacterium CG10_big_fil_rev_8_21_14_0_10_42_18 TaxID=1974552 RepID=A0A2H0VC18_9BACT|nr:MAG: RIP metalloprotease RseP [Candidatus Doudnabacteria bacterium CG10_big_fil_rev_8_21_14_0_10_42_18]
MFLTVIIFVVILGLLVFVHEFGHFWVAKKSGMMVKEFGFGFPPRMAGIQKIGRKFKFVWGHKEPDDPNQTVYSINWIPLGGFVKILGENNENEENPRSFINKGFWPRFFTLVAGVVMNVILAWVLISIGFGLGLPSAFGTSDNLSKGATLKEPQVIITEVLDESPAQKAGLMGNDVILSVDGLSFTNVSDASTYIRENRGKVFDFKVKRINEELGFDVASLSNPSEDEGPTGIVLANAGLLSFPWYRAIWEGAVATINALRAIVVGLYGIITTGLGFEALGGPVKIAQIARQVTDLGFIYILQFAAFLSLNLAILNILPFPALDGGRLVFLIIEKIRGKRNNQKVEQWVNTLGFVFLLLLMVLVTIKDIRAF